jgi:hypothetical protein
MNPEKRNENVKLLPASSELHQIDIEEHRQLCYSTHLEKEKKAAK